MKIVSYKPISFFSLFLITISLSAQNLVPNSSFEDTIQCPSDYGQIHYAPPWVDALVPGSVDLYHSCSDTTSIPCSSTGCQNAKTGEAYMGFNVSLLFGYREYPQIKLVDSLQVGKRYRMTLFVSRADEYKHIISQLGIYFSDTFITESAINKRLLFQPQIKLSLCEDNCISDSAWHEISGSFVASGGEKYIIIGNFKPDSLTTYKLVNPSGQFSGLYLYIDDVSLIEDTTTGIWEHILDNPLVKVYPNPAKESFQVSIELDQGDRAFIQVFDVNGKELLKKDLSNGNNNLNSSEFGAGIYFYKLYKNDSQIKNGKLIVQ